MRRPAGYVLAEDTWRVLILNWATRNPKTGRVAQTWTLRRDVDPCVAIANGWDVPTCFLCKQRPALAGGCYVNPRALRSVYAAYRRGAYPRLGWAEAGDLLRGAFVRLGAYGEVSGWLHVDDVGQLLRYASGWSGYSHAWAFVDARWSRFLMASCDGPAELEAARALGWRAFVVTPGEQYRPAGTFPCPSSKGVQCVSCKVACSGTSSRVRKDVRIALHGFRARAARRVIAPLWEGGGK